jgi:hypothetical protein
VTFAAASATPTFALASPTSFAAGDRLGIINEDPADATLAGVSLTFAGTRGSGAWGYIVGTYDKDAGTNNQRLY